MKRAWTRLQNKRERIEKISLSWWSPVKYSHPSEVVTISSHIRTRPVCISLRCLRFPMFSNSNNYSQTSHNQTHSHVRSNVPGTLSYICICPWRSSIIHPSLTSGIIYCESCKKQHWMKVVSDCVSVRVWWQSDTCCAHKHKSDCRVYRDRPAASAVDRGKMNGFIVCGRKRHSVWQSLIYRHVSACMLPHLPCTRFIYRVFICSCLLLCLSG